ncbi:MULTISPECIES: stage II sporulation protein M [Bacillus cereus group]|uniref:stage II sporulation protein M n=1 Tax=Bacillus cereus group TaxID=86661 RepID=UPI001BB36E7C|nr:MULTISPECIES: stage II sporulation protein M [Bacillus cereus group]MEB9458066.1 stage II sporulation protein M [Bacillus anthracis]QUW24602.1 stage II sporulation protein M [Bacillus cereus]
MRVILKIINKVVFKRAINFFILGVALTVIATIITFVINPDLKEIIEGIGNRLPDQVKKSEGIEKVWLYIVNNGFIVPLQMFILVLIPIQFLYSIHIILTSSLLGVVFGIVLQSDFQKGFGMIISTLPHFFFEVFAYCLFAAILFELNKCIRIKLKVMFKKDKERVSLSKKILEVIKIYIVLTLPIIIIAAFLETYITNIIFDLF